MSSPDDDNHNDENDGDDDGDDEDIDSGLPTTVTALLMAYLSQVPSIILKSINP